MTQPSIEGISQCMTKAMRESDIEKEDVDYIVHMAQERLPMTEQNVLQLKKVFGPRYKQIPVSSIKSMLGHTMGAASALEAISMCPCCKK